MLAAVSWTHLSRVKIGKNIDGRRIYSAGEVTDKDFEAIRQGVLIALNLTNLA